MGRKLAVGYLLLGLVVSQYQNCASSEQVFDQDVQVEAASVTSIDRIDVGSISFPQEKVQASFEQPLETLGICDQNGAIIAWQLVDQEGEKIEQGQAECDLGTFVVSVSEGWKSHCSKTLMLKAYLGAKASSQIELETFCE